MTEFQEYHRAWLASHPEVDEAWLSGMFRQGFGIHHIDGDHQNNDVINLVLIYWPDHDMIHRGQKRPIHLKPKVARPRRESLAIGKKCCQERRQYRPWAAIAETLSLPSAQVASTQARRYARALEVRMPTEKEVRAHQKANRRQKVNRPPKKLSPKQKHARRLAMHRERLERSELDMSPVC